MEAFHLGRAEVLRQTVELVGVGHGGALLCFPGERRDALVAQVGSIGVAGAAVEEHAQADAAAAGVGEALHLLLVPADLPRYRLFYPGLGVARAGGLRRL